MGNIFYILILLLKYTSIYNIKGAINRGMSVYPKIYIRVH